MPPDVHAVDLFSEALAIVAGDGVQPWQLVLLFLAAVLKWPPIIQNLADMLSKTLPPRVQHDEAQPTGSTWYTKLSGKIVCDMLIALLASMDGLRLQDWCHGVCVCCP